MNESGRSTEAQQAQRVGCLLESVRAFVTDDPVIGALRWRSPLVFAAAIAVGLVLGARDGATYASSLSTVVILAVSAGFGAPLAAWVGFVFGDLLLRDPTRAHIWRGLAPSQSFTELYRPLVISCLLLAGLLVAAPRLPAALAAE
jgi:hypothetical protein